MHWEPTVTSATIAGLSSGEFVGTVADEPGRELEAKVFHGRIVREEASGGDSVDGAFQLPIVREVSERVVRAAFDRVRAEVEEIVAAGRKRVAAGVAPIR
jgi:hypothetical protein